MIAINAKIAKIERQVISNLLLLPIVLCSFMAILAIQ